MRPDGTTRVRQPRPYYPDTAFLETFSAPALPPMVNIFADTTLHMQPETYDHVVAGANGPAQFLTSDQCVGCHAAGATGEERPNVQLIAPRGTTTHENRIYQATSLVRGLIRQS